VASTKIQATLYRIIGFPNSYSRFIHTDFQLTTPIQLMSAFRQSWRDAKKVWQEQWICPCQQTFRSRFNACLSDLKPRTVSSYT